MNCTQLPACEFCFVGSVLLAYIAPVSYEQYAFSSPWVFMKQDYIRGREEEQGELKQ